MPELPSAPRQIARLPERGIVGVTGPDARGFLQGLLSNDIGRLDTEPAIAAALLTPQGKILFEMLVVRRDAGYWLDVAAAAIPDLVKRLGFYRLRAKVEIADRSAEHRVVAIWGGGDAAPELPAAAAVYRDPRLPALGWRGMIAADATVAATATSADYRAHRIAVGVPEALEDYGSGEVFPHEALLDQLGGVGFAKGCYVGQEVVSRMEHRGLARNRLLPVSAAAELPAAGAEVTAGDVPLGRLAGHAGSRGLALIRLDRLERALAEGRVPQVAGLDLTIEARPWMRFAVPAAPGGRA